MNRLEGYYWVKLDNGLWCVAFYDAMNNEWDIPGLIPTRNDDDFLEIDENRIERNITLSGNVTITGRDLTRT